MVIQGRFDGVYLDTNIVTHTGVHLDIATFSIHTGTTNTSTYNYIWNNYNCFFSIINVYPNICSSNFDMLNV